MVKYMEPRDLAALVLSAASVLIVDVRDHDYQTGKVRTSVNVPYDKLNRSLPALLQAARSKSAVIFHCHFSARRGPSAASIFEDALGHTLDGGSVEVFVLRGGFERWHQLYKSNRDLYQPLTADSPHHHDTL